MRARWPWATALALGAITLAVIWYPGSPERNPEATAATATPADRPSPLLIRWQAGTAQQYRFMSDSSMQMDATSSGASAFHVRLQGMLNTLTLETSADEAVVGVQLSSVELTINGVTDAEVNQALTDPFRVRFAADGMPRAFDFSAATSTWHREILENLLRTFQVGLQPGDSWVRVETNGSGTYEAAYARAGAGRVEKSKRGFRSTAQGMLPWSGLESSEIILLEGGHDWLASMNVAETLRTDGGDGPMMIVGNQATLERIPGAGLALSPDRWQFAAAAAAVDDMAAAKVQRPIPAGTADEARQKILAAIPELDAAEKGRLSLVHRLTGLVLVDAGMPAVILDALRTGQLSERTRADLFLVLEKAGTASAQAALVEVMTDSSWPLNDGLRAIVAMADVENPTPDSIDALWNTAQAYSYGDERYRLASSATFALGTIGKTLNAADDREYGNLRSNLLANALTSVDVNRRANFVTALGNTRDQTLAGEIVVLLGDAEPAVRRATALALGALGADPVAEQLVAQYGRDDNVYVRGAIAESLQEWSRPSEEAMAVFRQTVLREPDESTRYHIAVLLSENLAAFPDNEVVLREIMRREPSRRIRQQVADALAARTIRP